MQEKKKSAFRRGALDSIPIALGYLSVSFGFGIAAVGGGLSPLTAVLISLTNLTSAGQMAGLAVIIEAGTLLEMALCQLVINIRYFLMSMSLSQRLTDRFPLRHRLLSAFGITDEIFGVASSRKEAPTPHYLYGLILFPVIGWTLGTLLGGVAGNILPEDVKHALGIMIYGMFVAIVVPPARKEKGVLLGVAVAAAVSCLFAYLPLFSSMTSGFSIVLSALLAAAVAAALFPVPGEDAKGGKDA